MSDTFLAQNNDLEPTNLQKQHGIPWSIGFNFLNTFFVQFTFFGSVFVLFLDALQLDKSQIGFILALMPFLDLISLFLASTVNKVGYKRTFLTFFSLRAFFSAFLLLTTMVIGQFGQQAVLYLIILVVMAFSISRSVGMTAWHPWQQEFIPQAMLGRYSATNSMFVSVAGVIAVSFAGYVVNVRDDLSGFLFLFALALVFAAGSIWSASRIPGGKPVKTEPGAGVKRVQPVSALRDKRFLFYLLGVGFVTLAIVPLGSFVPLFMQDVVGINSGNVVFLTVGILLGGLLSGYIWGWAADRYGSRPVMLSGVGFIAVLPILWMLMPVNSVWSFPIAMGIAVLRGALISGWTIGSARMLYAYIVPSEQRVPYMAVYTAWMGIASGISQMSAGKLLDITAGIQGEFLFFSVNSYTILFIVSMALGAISLLFLRKVQVDARISVGQFAGLFFHGNPLLAMESLIRYQFARDEPATVSVTERLGRSGSPLTVEELLEALQDPRFYVRFEAIVSIARRPADERLLTALVDVLRGNDPSLSVIAAWALGRIGDSQSAKPLREALDAPYRSIRAHAARSLGSLEDETSGKTLLERLDNEPDHGLQVAYASALGRLNVVEAAPKLLILLNEEQEQEFRAELALALARLLGSENDFVHIWRQQETDAGTSLSEVVLNLRKKFVAAGGDVRQWEEIDRCIESFSRQDLEQGVQELSALLARLPVEQFDQLYQVVLQDCQDKLGKYGASRVEYVVLALEALNQGWQYQPGEDIEYPHDPIQ